MTDPEDDDLEEEVGTAPVEEPVDPDPMDEEEAGEGAPGKRKRVRVRDKRVLTIKEDGALNSARAEKSALMQADGISAWKAWQLLGGRDWGSSGIAAKMMKNDPAFVERLATLMAEKEELERDPHWGTAKWAAVQMWRTARVTNDNAMAMEAMKVLARLAEKSGAGMVAAPIEPENRPKPGKPSVEVPRQPQNGGEITKIRAELLRFGAPKAVEDAA